MTLSRRNSTMRDLQTAWSISQIKPISCSNWRWRSCTQSMTLATLVSTSCHSSVGVGGGCSQVARGSTWVGVELPPRLLAPPVDIAAPEARRASCLTLNVSRQLGKMGSFTMFQWWGSATERGTVIWSDSSNLGGNTCSCLEIQLHSVLPWRQGMATCADGGSPPLIMT